MNDWVNLRELELEMQGKTELVTRKEDNILYVIKEPMTNNGKEKIRNTLRVRDHLKCWKAKIETLYVEFRVVIWKKLN